MRWALVVMGVVCATALPTLASASHGDGALININTANVETLDTLEGIGETLANRIVAYREANGPFAAIEDIIHPTIERLYQSTFDKIKDHITVEESTTTSSQSTAVQETVLTNITQFSYESVTIQPPQDVYIRVPESMVATAGAFLTFPFESYDATGKVVEDGNVQWAFGDGSTATGRDVGHTFLYEGGYTVRVLFTRGSLRDTKDIAVTVVPLEAEFSVDESGKWVALQNNSSESLNVSNWRITTDYQYFVIPEGTIIQSGMEVRFPTLITKLSLLKATKRAFLKYPNGTVAYESTEAQQEESISTDGVTSEDVVTAIEAPVVQSVAIVGKPTPEPVEKSTIDTEVQLGTSTIAHPEQAAAIVLSSSVETRTNKVYWYSALVGVLIFAIVGVFFTRSRNVGDERNIGKYGNRKE